MGIIASTHIVLLGVWSSSEFWLTLTWKRVCITFATPTEHLKFDLMQIFTSSLHQKRHSRLLASAEMPLREVTGGSATRLASADLTRVAVR
jgi:hypothetical protein